MRVMNNELAHMSWPEAKAAFERDAIVILPIGSTEPHGPHLPLDTDVTIALAQARAAARRLEGEGVACVIAPPVAYGLTNFTEGFAGRITIRPGTLFSLVEDILLALGQEGCKRVVMSNAHLEPAHIKVLRSLVLDFEGPDCHPDTTAPHVIFPDNTRRRWAGTLGDEFQSGECHAGSYEASIVMVADPTAVRVGEMRKLPAVDLDLINSMQSGVGTFVEMGSENAYNGDPAAASEEEGHMRIEALADMICTSIRETWPELF
jgi:creatinine amidohydrolase